MTLQEPRSKLYLLRGEQLSLEVTEGRLSSLDARVLWQKLFVELKSAKDAEGLAAADSVARYLTSTRPAQSPSVNCTSTQYGNTAYTNCR